MPTTTSLAKRIIPCLDIKDGQTVKGINFENLTYAGSPLELAKGYASLGADELVLLDITATIEGRNTFLDTVRSVAAHLNIPLTVGGGISCVADVDRLLSAGADKISINTAAIKSPSLIDQLAKAFGSQCVVVAIDTRSVNGGHRVHSAGGRKLEPLETLAWAIECNDRGAGEILLTSMDADGTKAGFDLPITAQVSQAVSVPVIASGGAGTTADFLEVFSDGKADAALAASVFHFNLIPILELKKFLKDKGVSVRI